MPRAPRYCIRKGHAFYGHMAIPPDCRHAFAGRKMFMVPLHTADPVEAAAKVGPMVREWKARIKAVRTGLHDPQRDLIDKLAVKYRKLHDPLDDAGARLVADVIDFVFREVGGMTALQQHMALTATRSDVLQALRAAPQATRAARAMQQIISSDEAQTPFLAYSEKWEATLPKTKTAAAWKNIIKEFDYAVAQPLERLAGKHVQAWIEDLLGAKKNPRTVRYKLGALIAYWKWMAAHQIVDGDRNPFKGREVKSKQSKVERASASKMGFPPCDVPKLWREAETDGDFDLFVAITLSAYMGWRLEEVCRLKIADVQRTSGTFYIDGGMKTEAGVRSLPVPTAIVPLVEQLMKRQDSDGYLIRSSDANKWKQRGNAIGKRFSKMKGRLGYDRRRSFHSLRHTYATLLAHGGVSLNMIRDLMGHQGNGDVTLGYIDPSDLLERLHWLDKAIQFSEAPPHG